MNNDSRKSFKGAFEMIALLIVLITLFVSCGCLKPVSLEDYGYVISVGLDRGSSKKYYITLMLQRESSGQSSADSEGGVIALAAEGDDIFDAVNTIESNLPYMLNFSRTAFLLFGKEAAENGMLYDFLETPLDLLRIRASAVVVISESTASEFIGGLAANNNANITKLQTSILLDREKTGMVSIMSVSRMYEAGTEGRFDFCCALGAYDENIITDMEQKKTEAEGGDPIAEVSIGDRVGGLKSYISGSALFDGWIMRGTLDKQETMLLNIAVGEFSTVTFAEETDNGASATVVLQKGTSDIRFVGFDESGAPCFTVDIDLVAGVHQTDPGMNADETASWLSEKVGSAMERRLEALLEKCREASCDAMRFGTVISKTFPSTAEWEAFDWKSRYPQMKAEFRVTLHAVDKYSAEGMK